MEIERKLETLRQVLALYDGFAGTLETACRTGCSRCCTDRVTLTTLEACALLETSPGRADRAADPLGRRPVFGNGPHHQRAGRALRRRPGAPGGRRRGRGRLPPAGRRPVPGLRAAAVQLPLLRLAHLVRRAGLCGGRRGDGRGQHPLPADHRAHRRRRLHRLPAGCRRRARRPRAQPGLPRGRARLHGLRPRPQPSPARPDGAPRAPCPHRPAGRAPQGNPGLTQPTCNSGDRTLRLSAVCRFGLGSTGSTGRRHSGRRSCPGRGRTGRRPPSP